MYAVCLSDLTNTEVGRDVGIQILVGPVLTDQTVDVQVDKIDGTAIVLACDDERGAAIHELVRTKYPKYRLRIFHSKTGRGGWRSI